MFKFISLINFYIIFPNFVFFCPQSIILTFNLPTNVYICIKSHLTFILQAPRYKSRLACKVKNIRFLNVTVVKLIVHRNDISDIRHCALDRKCPLPESKISQCLTALIMGCKPLKYFLVYQEIMNSNLIFLLKLFLVSP